MRHSPPLQDGHHIQLIEGGQAYFDALVVAIDQARAQVQLETYIFDFHGASSNVAQALERAALRGVQVAVVVDGVGTPRIPPNAGRPQRSEGSWTVWGALLGLLSYRAIRK